MSDDYYIKVLQKTFLFKLLSLRAENEKLGIKVAGLHELIVSTEVAMEQEDVAWVEKKIAELQNS